MSKLRDMERPHGTEAAVTRSFLSALAGPQSVRDALADAATLRHVVLALAYAGGPDCAAESVARDLTLCCMGGVVLLHPEEAARAAFRACPALREAR